MSDIGYNDNLNVAGRKFHIQTASNLNHGTARCEVFEEGRVITTNLINFERRQRLDEESMEKRVREIVEDLHRETLNEIDLMFQIAEKIKKLKHAPSNIKMGLLFLHNNLIRDAIEQFEVALSLDPDSAEARNALGLTYLRLGQNIKAVNILNQALEKGQVYADIFHNLGVAYLSENQYYKALTMFQEALRINKNYYEAQYNLIIVYLGSILKDRSDSLLPPPSIRLERANKQIIDLASVKIKGFDLVAGKVQKAIKAEDLLPAIKTLLEHREKLFPMDIYSLIGTDFYLKFMYGGRGMDRGIINKFERKLYDALEENQDYADLWNNLGIVHLIQCRNLFLQALSEFNRALEINPSFEKALKNKKLVENDGKEFLILLKAILK